MSNTHIALVLSPLIVLMCWPAISKALRRVGLWLTAEGAAPIVGISRRSVEEIIKHYEAKQ